MEITVYDINEALQSLSKPVRDLIQTALTMIGNAPGNKDDPFLEITLLVNGKPDNANDVLSEAMSTKIIKIDEFDEHNIYYLISDGGYGIYDDRSGYTLRLHFAPAVRDAISKWRSES